MAKIQEREIKVRLQDLDIEDFTNDIVRPKKVSSQKLTQWAWEEGFISSKRAFGDDGERQTITPIFKCGDLLTFVATKDFNEKHLYDARFCNWRFCPMCAWRLALKRVFVLKIVMAKLSKEKYRFLFVTLTAPNVLAEELSVEITRYNQGFQRLIQRKKYKNFIVGGVRKLEVTHNEKANTYHPHLHILLCVKADYFKRVNQKNPKTGEKENFYPNMIMIDEWREDWQRAMRNELAEQIDVKAISNNPKKLAKSIVELSKYTVKDSEMTESKEVFSAMYKGLKGKRLFSPFGNMKKLFSEFKKDPQSFSEYFEMREPKDWYWKIIEAWQNDRKDYDETWEELTDEEITAANKRYVGFLTEGLDTEE